MIGDMTEVLANTVVTNIVQYVNVSIDTLHNLNLHNAICQLYLNKHNNSFFFLIFSSELFCGNGCSVRVK